MSIEIITDALPFGFCKEPYNFCLKVKVIPPRTVNFALVSKFLPIGLNFSSEGIISGVPLYSTHNTITFEARVAEPEEVAQKSLILNIYNKQPVPPSPSEKLTICTTSLVCNADDDCDILLIAKGGCPPYSWKCEGLPRGLELIDNRIVGRIHVSGGSPFITLSVIDSVCEVCSLSFFMEIL